MALKVKVDELLNVNKLIGMTVENFKEVVDKISSASSSFYEKIDTGDLNNTVNDLKNAVQENVKGKIDFITETVRVLEEAMGLTVDELQKVKHSQDEYEHAIIRSFVSRYNNDINNLGTGFSNDNLVGKEYQFLYDFMTKNDLGYFYDTKVVRYNEIYNFLNEFKEKNNYDFINVMKLSEFEVYKEFINLYDRYCAVGVGNQMMDMDKVYKGLIEFFPPDFDRLNLSVSMMKKVADEDRPDRDNLDSKVDYYTYYYELTTGKKILFESILGSDCTSIEKMLILFHNVAATKTIESLPKEYVNIVIDSLGRTDEDGNPCLLILNNEFFYEIDNDDVSDYEKKLKRAGGYIPYYRAITFPPLYLEKLKSSNDSRYSSVDNFKSMFIHEFAHAFDDAICNVVVGENDKGWLALSHAYDPILISDSSKTWGWLFERYKDKLWSVQNQSNGYKNYDVCESDGERYSEFFAEAMRAYFENPVGLATTCPELFEEIQAMLKKYGIPFYVINN